MKKMAFLSLFGQRRPDRAPAGTRRRSSERRRGKRPAVETLEDRTLLSVLPPPLVSSHPNIPGVTTATATGNTPAVAVDPLNPQKVVTVYSTGATVAGAFSTNGGQNWVAFAMPAKLNDPNIAAATQYAQAIDPSVAFDRAGNLYVVYAQRDAANNSGAITLQRFNFSGNTPSVTLANKLLHRWVGADAGMNPMLAVDNNLPTFTDPDTGAVQTNPLVGTIYVAWNTNNATPMGAANFNPNTIKIVASADQGNNFTTQRFVNDGQGGDPNFGPERNALPQLVVSQASARTGVPGGQLSLVWNDFGRNRISFDRIVDGGVGAQFTGTGGAVVDATAPATGNHIPATTTFTIPVNITDARFTTVSDVDVTVGLTHAALAEVLIRLVAPNGQAFNLINNATNAAGQAVAPAQGITGANLGTVNNNLVGTVFDQQAARGIRDASATAPFAARFRPETGSLNVFNGLTAAQVNGNWQLQITDFRNGNVGNLLGWSLNFTSKLTPGTDGLVGTTTVVGAAVAPYPLRPAAAPDRGISPAPALAVDNTLGSFSPFQGRLYVAYVDRSTAAGNPADNTDIFVRTSDNGGLTWSSPVRVNDDAVADSFSEGDRPQFQPAVAVDPFTGTLAISYFDTRHDAARARVATFLATSIDGGRTFGPQTFLNRTEGVINPLTGQARPLIDAITGERIVLGPVPGNQTTNNAARDTTFAFGDRQGLAVVQGRVYAVWAGNLNTGPGQVLTARATIAAGPRVVDSTMGPIEASSILGRTFNNTFSADGVRQLDAFTVTFDRRVDPSTFNAGDVTVIYRSPTTPISEAGTPVAVGSVTPLDTNPFGATTFLVTLAAPQSATGTYSYSIGPNVRDRIRSPIPGVVTTTGSTFTVSPSPVNLRVPPAGTGGTGNPSQDVTRSTLTISGVPAAQLITDLNVNLTLNHTFTGDLVLTLVAPDGSRILLANRRGGGGENFLNTTFDDQADTPIAQASAPFSGSFRPEAPLSALNGTNPNGVWTLNIDDQAGGDVGTLVTWSLTINSGTPSGTSAPGAFMDQNGDGVTDQFPGDAYATPRPLGGVPFRAPYDQETLPLIVPGPHVVSTRVLNHPATNDNLVLNSPVHSIDVVFDRNLDARSFSPADVLRMTGPLGVLPGPFTILPNPNGTDPDPSFPRTYRIGFPTQQYSGTYTIVLGPDIRAKNGDPLDTNRNAGVDVLRGASPTETARAEITFAPTQPVTLVPQKTVTSTITVSDDLIIQGATLRLDITHPNDPDLEATLIAPDGTRIRLFTQVGNSGGRQDFTSTVFDDLASTPIQLGLPPFFGRFNPQTPLSVLRGKSALGPFTLEIKNHSTVNTGTLNTWALTLHQSVPGTGLGEAVADRTTVSFRIFTMDALNPVSHTTWTAVGPAANNSGAHTGRIGGLAVDPSDPSGNTVYVAGASGGVWKTTNFLTTNPAGPTYQPLTDFGPTTAINVGGIAVFGRNQDPNQSVVFVLTGEGDTGTPGVGFLRSIDGGATWHVLDSSVNFDVNGNLLPLRSSQRDHLFVGTTGFKVVVDPSPTPTSELVLYAALSGPAASAGLWRSVDTGRTWQRMRAGQATDVVLAAGSYSETTGNLQIVYAAFRGEGVFFSPNQGVTWSLMAGGQGNTLLRDADVTPTGPIAVVAPPSTPNGAQGRIHLATPFPTGNPLHDFNYQGWLYALVVTPAGALLGLYQTKDFGQNWTRVRIPARGSVPTNDESVADYALLFGTNNMGNYDLTLAIDPNNPNVVYLGGVTQIRVDTTGIADAHSLFAFETTNPDGGLIQTATRGGVNLKNTANYFGLLSQSGGITVRDNNQYLNLFRDPNNPFLTNATVLLTNVAQFNNTGTETRWMPFSDVLEGTVDLHRVVTFRDPLTGHTRLIFGDDQGVYTAVDRGDGTLIRNVGTAPVVTGSRNGNLQITQQYFGAAQPSILAAEIAGALFYSNTQDLGQPRSSALVLATGNLNWTGPLGDGTGVATDQTGSGIAYHYNWPCCGGDGTNFFQVTRPGANPIGRTFGLIQQNQPGQTPDPQWPFLAGFPFTVNPLNGNQMLLASDAGRVFRTQNQGLIWFVIANPADLDGTRVPALAYGAPDPNAPSGVGNLDNFIYAGTEGGNLFVTFTGGGSTGNQWINLSTGLDGSPVQAIVANPLRGSHQAYAVTQRGVYHMFDSSVPNAAWQNVTGNLFQVLGNVFDNPADPDTRLRILTSIVADWRFALPDDPGNPAGSTHPILYVGGDGGVFRSLDGGFNWTLFPDVASDGAPRDGGLLPNVRVTDLDLAVGNINPTTGQPDTRTGPNLLVATTFGRGTFAIRLQNNLAAGPSVVAITPAIPVVPGLARVTVTFSGPVDPATFTLADIQSFTGPNGPITPLAVRDITTVPAGTGNPHNVYEITFAPQRATGTYTLVFGPAITDFAGNALDTNRNGINGEPADTVTIRFEISNNDHGQFLSAVYSDLLGRLPDTEGFISAVNVLDPARVAALPAVATGFVIAPESRSNLIYNPATDTGFYRKFLGRAATPAEISSWVVQLQRGVTPEQVIVALVSSPEYFQKNGATNDGFVFQLYVDVLGRVGDIAGRDFWVRNLNNGSLTRAQVAQTFTSGVEYRTNLVTTTYVTYLAHQPSLADLNFWVPRLAGPSAGPGTPSPAEQLVAFVVGSQEFFQRAGNTNVAWVTSLYRQVLSRAPDAAGFTFHVNALLSGYQAQRQSVALAVTATTEYRSNLVAGYFQTYLRRAASSDDLAFWVGFLQGGGTDEQVIAELVASQEYFNRAGGTNLAWVNQVFLDLLGRPAGGTTIPFNLDNGSLTRTQAALAILSSQEYRQRLVSGYFSRYLGRSGSTTEVDFYVQQLQRGLTAEQVSALFLATNEYFLRPRSF